MLLIFLPNGEYSNVLIASAFSSMVFSDKNLYLLIFPDDKTEIYTVSLSILY